MGRHIGDAANAAERIEQEILFDLILSGVRRSVGTGGLFQVAFPVAGPDSPIFDDLVARAVALRTFELSARPVAGGRRSATTVPAPVRRPSEPRADTGTLPVLAFA